jgi:uncharacterized protein (DUF433 family)
VRIDLYLSRWCSIILIVGVFGIRRLLFWELRMKDRIEVNPRVHFGKPCVAGTRTPVVDVLELVAAGIGFDQIIKDYYPQLEKEDIQACIRYAIDVVSVEDIHVKATS